MERYTPGQQQAMACLATQIQVEFRVSVLRFGIYQAMKNGKNFRFIWE
jgi:hypothetical protein